MESTQKFVAVKKSNPIIRFAQNNKILLSILVSIVIGFVIGIVFKEAGVSSSVVQWFTLPGSLFIRALELLILPVIFFGVVAATSSLSAQNNLKITLICFGLTLLTHVVATLFGLFGSLILIALSKKNSEIVNTGGGKEKTTYDIITDILRNIIPKNIIKATINQELTIYRPVVNANTSEVTFKPEVKYIDGTNILGILVFGLLIGLSTSVLDKKTSLFREFFKQTNDVLILILRWFILLAPVGIASLIIDAIFDVKDLGDSFEKIGLFALLCVATLLFYTIFLGVFIYVFTRSNPLKYFYYFLEPMLLAFASTSGAVCIHKSLDICESKLNMDPRLSRFTIPFYTTIQADGSSIFIVMSCAFLATYSNVTLSASDFAVIIVLTCILCFSLPSVPSSSIVTILVVLNSINLSGLNIALLYTVEWLLDRVRTAVNLYSHCFCAVATHELCKKSLASLELQQQQVNDQLTETEI
jgi:Na+/H+-dicarboxylate symporter